MVEEKKDRILKKKSIEQQVPWKELTIFLLGLIAGVVFF
jgi:hypothetical protein